MQVLNLDPNLSEYEMLENKYNEKHRAYHNLTHIKDCLNHLDEYNQNLEDKHEIELAIFYHDVIYNPYRKDNEPKSADLAILFLNNQKVEHTIISKIEALIIATIHQKSPETRSQAIIMDIDIATLGSEPSVYLEYSQNIRKEYSWVPMILYKRKRKEILNNFLKRERLYYTDYFFHKFETQARINLQGEINRLM